MPLIVLDLVGAPDAISGALSRRLIEVRAGLFVGSVSTRSIATIWSMVENSKTTSSTLIYPARNELGLSIRQHGSSGRRRFDFDGLVLMGIDARKKTE